MVHGNILQKRKLCTIVAVPRFAMCSRQANTVRACDDARSTLERELGELDPNGWDRMN